MSCIQLGPCVFTYITCVFTNLIQINYYYYCERNKETNKSLSENNDTMIESTFWSMLNIYRDQILINFGKRGLVTCYMLRVSHIVLVHLQWSQTESGVKKPFPLSVSCLVSQDRSWTLIAELSQGTSEKKINLKWDTYIHTL